MNLRDFNNMYTYLAISYFFVSLFFAVQDGKILKLASFFFLISFGINAFKAIKEAQNRQ
ncbi:hypothetical protein P7D97_11860 [Enterococcus raffinosus]|uniref:hypothetical protein n=1 Tax=Enterococcus raffinosus TaxID=71452 RepID=UPI001C45EEE9|nr:hypothetical protein [Enterococcus raffinosus]MDT2572302.1 hypothetical protein [Enterococcus raffinosus]QXJ61215.1 hypothetical protein J9537_20080 [Enterococcus raffinosus]